MGRHSLNTTQTRTPSRNTRPVTAHVSVIHRRRPAHAAEGSGLAGLAVRSVTVGLMAVSVSDLAGPLAMASAAVPAVEPEVSAATVSETAQRQSKARLHVTVPLRSTDVSRPEPQDNRAARKPAAKRKADLERKPRESGAHGRHRAVPPAPGHVREWIGTAIAIMRDRGIPVSQRDAASIWTIVQKESSGNPRAINLWDSNFRAGHPSKGLMQTIDSTFAAYKLPGYDDIYHPVHNIIAGVRYTLSRYGGFAGHPGLRSLAAGGGYVGY